MTKILKLISDRKLRALQQSAAEKSALDWTLMTVRTGVVVDICAELLARRRQATGKGEKA